MDEGLEKDDVGTLFENVSIDLVRTENAGRLGYSLSETMTAGREGEVVSMSD